MRGARIAADLACSFCASPRRSVRLLLQGVDANICDRCVLAARGSRPRTPFATRLGHRVQPSPESIVRRLDERVVGQTHAKRVLAVAAHNHLKRLAWREVDPATEPAKSNVLLVGPSGSGKTLLMRTLAHILGLPFIVADAAALTEAGYHGDGVEDLLHRLLQAADFDVELAQQGIVFVDELDKIARRADPMGGRRDVGGEGVQYALLRMLEGAVVSVPVRGPRPRFQDEDTIDIDTRSILFVGGGAFVGLDRIVAARGRDRRIGFGARLGTGESAADAPLSDVGPEDLMAFGFAPEFIGRWPVIAALRELTEDDLLRVLIEPRDALIRQYQHVFALDGIALEFEEASLRTIARRAAGLGTGARALRTVLESILLGTMFETLGRTGIGRVVVTADAAAGLGPPLQIRNPAASARPAERLRQ